MVGGAIAALLFAVAAVVFILRKKRNSLQETKPITASESTEDPHQKISIVRDMHEDARPIELTERALHELHAQSLQEIEQPRQCIELYAHEYPEMQVNR